MPDLLLKMEHLIYEAAKSSTCDHAIIKQYSDLLAEVGQYEFTLVNLFYGRMQASPSDFTVVRASALLSQDPKLDALSQSIFGIAFSLVSFCQASLWKRFWQSLLLVRDMGSQVTSVVRG